MNFEKIGLNAPTILVPNSNVDMTKWAVVACDQYTSEPEYWENVKNFVGNSPSTLNIVYPEVYLESKDKDQIINSINKTMKQYLDEGVFVALPSSFVLLDRKTSHAQSRKGLMVALDLEKYDYTKGSQTLIRATEGTIIDRLPPRIKIRKNAVIESPHIMVLIDDPERTVIEPLFKNNLKKLTDTELMMNSGHLKSWLVDDPKLINQVAENLMKLADPERFNKKYGCNDKGVLLFAMGDGNHSFATAKAIWEELKKESGGLQKVKDHPARFALVELVNVHDEGLSFEPIHRVLFNVNVNDILAQMKNWFEKQGSTFTFKYVDDKNQLDAELEKNAAKNVHHVPFMHEERFGYLTVKNPKLTLEVGTLQEFLDQFLKANTQTSIDYIHGEYTVINLSNKPGNLGFCLPPMSKHDLFKTVIFDGALPRKTFSMGEADEKRFYLECRKITLT